MVLQVIETMFNHLKLLQKYEKSWEDKEYISLSYKVLFENDPDVKCVFMFHFSTAG